MRVLWWYWKIYVVAHRIKELTMNTKILSNAVLMLLLLVCCSCRLQRLSWLSRHWEKRDCCFCYSNMFLFREALLAAADMLTDLSYMAIYWQFLSWRSVFVRWFNTVVAFEKRKQYAVVCAASICKIIWWYRKKMFFFFGSVNSNSFTQYIYPDFQRKIL